MLFNFTPHYSEYAIFKKIGKIRENFQFIRFVSCVAFTIYLYFKACQSLKVHALGFISFHVSKLPNNGTTVLIGFFISLFYF